MSPSPHPSTTTTMSLHSLSSDISSLLSSLRAQYSLRNTQSALPLFSLALLTCFAFFFSLAPHFKQPKQRAWILTLLASACMTASSVPFVIDWARAGGSVGAVGRRAHVGQIVDGAGFFGVGGLSALDGLALVVNRSFQAYLICDLTIGSIFYPSEVALLTGWVHHILYVFICDYAIAKGWAHLFCFAAIMELPTLQLALARLLPRFRSDTLFAFSFFTFRIAFNLVLIYSYAVPRNRDVLLGGSWVPVIILSMAFGMHCMWFRACVVGILRRRGGGVKAEKKVGVEVGVDVGKVEALAEKEKEGVLARSKFSSMEDHEHEHGHDVTPADAESAVSTPGASVEDLDVIDSGVEFDEYDPFRAKEESRMKVKSRAGTGAGAGGDGEMIYSVVAPSSVDTSAPPVLMRSVPASPTDTRQSGTKSQNMGTGQGQGQSQRMTQSAFASTSAGSGIASALEAGMGMGTKVVQRKVQGQGQAVRSQPSLMIPGSYPASQSQSQMGAQRYANSNSSAPTHPNSNSNTNPNAPARPYMPRRLSLERALATLSTIRAYSRELRAYSKERIGSLSGGLDRRRLYDYVGLGPGSMDGMGDMGNMSGMGGNLGGMGGLGVGEGRSVAVY